MSLVYFHPRRFSFLSCHRLLQIPEFEIFLTCRYFCETPGTKEEQKSSRNVCKSFDKPKHLQFHFSYHLFSVCHLLDLIPSPQSVCRSIPRLLENLLPLVILNKKRNIATHLRGSTTSLQLFSLHWRGWADLRTWDTGDNLVRAGQCWVPLSRSTLSSDSDESHSCQLRVVFSYGVNMEHLSILQCFYSRERPPSQSLMSSSNTRDRIFLQLFQLWWGRSPLTLTAFRTAQWQCFSLYKNKN